MQCWVGGSAANYLYFYVAVRPCINSKAMHAWECAAHRWASKFVPCLGMHERGSWLRSGGVKRTTVGLLTLCFSIGVSAFFKLRVQSPRSLFLLPHFSASSLFFAIFEEISVLYSTSLPISQILIIPFFQK